MRDGLSRKTGAAQQHLEGKKNVLLVVRNQNAAGLYLLGYWDWHGLRAHAVVYCILGAIDQMAHRLLISQVISRGPRSEGECMAVQSWNRMSGNGQRNPCQREKGGH